MDRSVVRVTSTGSSLQFKQAVTLETSLNSRISCRLAYRLADVTPSVTKLQRLRQKTKKLWAALKP